MEKRRLHPKNDFIFKRLFGEEKSREWLIAFLNAIIYPGDGHKIVDVTVIDNKQLTKEMVTDKTGVLDILAETDEREQINVEMQVESQPHMDRRTLFYMGKLFVGSIQAGDEYDKLKRTITINLLDFRYFANDRFHNSFHLYEDHDKTLMLSDAFEIHFLEFPKFRTIRHDWTDPLHRWLLFLDEKLTDHQLEELKAMDPTIRKAAEQLELLCADKDVVRLYEARQKAKHEYNSRISYAVEQGLKEGREQGMREGLEEGIKEGIREGIREGIQQGVREGIQQGVKEGKLEVARNLLALRLDIAQIAEATGLSEEELRHL